MKSFFICALALTTALSMSSCTTRLLKLSVAGAKGVNLEDAAHYTATHNVPTEGTDRSHIFLIFPIGSPKIDHAMDDALSTAGPNAVALYNMTLDQTNWYIPFIYGQKIYTVKGDPVYREEGPAPAAAAAGAPQVSVSVAVSTSGPAVATAAAGNNQPAAPAPAPAQTPAPAAN